MNRFCVLLILGFLMVSSPAWAQIFIEQGKVELTVVPGQTVMGTVTVHNTSDQEARVSGYWEDFQYQPPFNGTKKFFPAGTVERSMAQWATLSPQEFTLPPFGKQEISYAIKVAGDINGGYYGVLFLENLDEAGRTRTGVRVITRVGCLFFLKTESPKKQAVFERVAIDERTITGKFENQGDVILIADAVFYVLNEGGLVADRGQGAKIYLPPGETADYELTLKEDMPPGEYTMVVTFDLEDGHVLVYEIDLEKSGSPGYRILRIRS